MVEFEDAAGDMSPAVSVRVSIGHDRRLPSELPRERDGEGSPCQERMRSSVRHEDVWWWVGPAAARDADLRE